MIYSKKRGFALPTVLIASVIMLTVLLVAVSATAAVRASLKMQYYNQLSQSAGEAGTAYAKACLAVSNGVPQWSNDNPLRPGTDCSGVQLAGFTCPDGATDARCFVSSNDNVVSTFSVALPEVDANGVAANVNAVGSVNLLRASNKTTWRSFSQTASAKVNTTTVSVLVVGGGGGGGGIIGGGGGGGGVQYDSDFAITSESYSVTVGSGGSGGVGWNNYPQRGYQGNNSAFVSSEASQYGFSADYPGKSCYSLKLDGIDTDGVYWIDTDGAGAGAPFQVWCDMAYDGGGWTLLLKATRGTTFNYSSSYWTTNNTLNPTDVSRQDGDAKYQAFNDMQLTDIMARWPDAGDMRWLRNSTWNNLTALTGFNTYANWGSPTSQSYWNGTYFSTETGIMRHGTKLLDAGGTTGVRWGNRYNNEADFSSDDVGNGIGMTMASYSAGDYVGCCAVTTGMNRSARVELYGRNKSDTADVESALIAVGGGGGGAHGGVDPRGPTSGGSGGGGSAAGTAGGAGVAGQGYAGGTGSGDNGGGGGGAGAAGVNYGAGGDGAVNSISGSVVYYGGGGGGGGRYGVGTADPGGKGGGGSGTNSDTKAGDGIANTGGGGGGAGYQAGTTSLVGGNGGSGVVIISYPTGSLTATGGTITKVGANTVHTFTSSGQFNVVLNVASIKMLVVGGGGSGGGSTGGGGGAGGVVYYDSYGVAARSYQVTVGSGGAIPGNKSRGISGGNSAFGTVTALGGGGGAHSADGTSWSTAYSGGSGGGGQTYFCVASNGVNCPSGAGTPGQGNSGGLPSNTGTSGGGGAGGPGGNTTTAQAGGNGGPGIAYSISGSLTYYGGGGGGGGGGTTSGIGGIGGGGAGGNVGSNGVDGTGGGGGGGWSYASGNGGKGGSGIVIISYPTGSVNASGGTVTTSGGYTIHTFTSSGYFEVGDPVTVYAWGGGGAGGTQGGWIAGSVGGAGGAANGKFNAITNTSYEVVVGAGGTVNSYNGGSVLCANGGGGCASWNGTDNRYGSGGGGYSGVFRNNISQSDALLVAAGGGGGGSVNNATYNSAGGAGGGLTGQNGTSSADGNYAGRGGSQSAAGVDASCDSPNTSGGQTALQGGRSKINGYGGAGGGGYWGGSGGGYKGSTIMGGGGGGSSYYNPLYISYPVLSGGSGTTPGDSANAYRGTAGNAGAVATNGSTGKVVITYPTGSLEASGGTVTIDGANTVHTFTSNGRFVIGSSLATVKVLVVAGGGGGGGFGGGGGAGAVIYRSSYPISTSGSYGVTIGQGGAGAAYGTTGLGGTNGGNSIFGTIVAQGGGGGASRVCGSPCYGTAGRWGGNGGGGSPSDNSAIPGTPGASRNFAVGGFSGGFGSNIGWGGGGGGGAGGGGGSATAATEGVLGGNGGVGLAYDMDGDGTSTYYGGGGGGCAHNTGIVGSGGNGGGGAGGKNTGTGNGVAGTANTGGGGGGSGAGSYVGGAGGSGIVIVSYPTGSMSATGGTVTTYGGNTIHTFTNSGLFSFDLATQLATIENPTVTGINGGMATLGAEITDDGGNITERGTCWGTTANPSTNCISEGATSEGVYSHNRTGMPPGTTIYYRGYAVNNIGTSYSADGTFTSGDYLAQVLVVAGGGGGGFDNGGGGGAGGVVYHSSLVLSSSSNTVTVGSGGSGATGAGGRGGTGGNSTALGITALGGGGGGSGEVTGNNGGSGGGGGGCRSGRTYAGGSATQTDSGGGLGYGFGGGTGVYSGGYAGAGGGGSSATGLNGGSPGNGGAGRSYTISGGTVYYGGGGGGGGDVTAGTGGTGGGGSGRSGDGLTGYSGTANTGGGGGGGSGESGSGGTGGSGIVIISYPSGSMSATGGNVTTSGSNTIHTFTSGGTFVVN